MKIKIISIMLISLFFPLFIYVAKYYKLDIDCAGDIYIELRNQYFDGNIKYYISDSNGYAKVTGVLNANDERKIVSRVIYFTLERYGSQVLMLSKKIDKTKTDGVDDEDVNKILPSFYVFQGKYLNISIDEARNGFVFYTSNIPSLYCQKNI